jgi:hypothetical protein
MAKVLRLTVEASIDDRYISDPESLSKDLEGEVVKVNSGAYDNLLMGNICEVEITRGEVDQFPVDAGDSDSKPNGNA